MRLINLFVFFFAVYGNTFARAALTLDLDNFDPELVNLNVQNFPAYTLENFSDAAGKGFDEVVDSGNALWTGLAYTNDLVENALVYTVKSVPQLVQLYLTPSKNFLYFKKVGNTYQEVGNDAFENLKDTLANGHFVPNKQYALNLMSKFNNRQFFTKQAGVVDGVNSWTFTPNNLDLKLTKVTDGLLPLYTVPTGHLVTSVVVSLKYGEPVGTTVTVVSHGYTVASYFKKVNNTWEEVDYGAFKRLLHTLVTTNVADVLTLDLSEPTETHFQVVKEFEPGVSKTHYTPLPTFNVTKVVNAGVPLWASHDYTATKVLTYTVENVLRLVKVTTKSPEGVEEDVNLERVPGGFAPLNDQEFSVHVNKLLHEGQVRRPTELPPDDEGMGEEDAGEGPSGQPVQPVQPFTTTLDVLAPNQHFFVKHGTFRGVPVKMFFAQDQVTVKEVDVSAKKVWETENGSTFVSAYLFYKNKEPKVVEVRVVENGGEKLYDRLSNEDGVWALMLDHYFEQFLDEARAAPNPGDALFVDLDKDVNDHATREYSQRWGVKAVSFHAEEGFHFEKVHLGTQLLWTNENHPNASLVKATGYFDNLNEYGKVVLVELEGFLNGEYKTYYYALQYNGWVSVNKQTFDKQFLDLRRGPQHTPEEVEEPETEVEQPPVPKFQVVNLDTANVDEEKVSALHQRGHLGYYFSSYTPRDGYMFGDVQGPEDFHFQSRHEKYVTFVKFFSVHGQLVGARLDTVNANNLGGPLTYYYTYQNKEWTYTMNDRKLADLLTEKLSYTESQKQSLQNALKADQQFREVMEKLEQAKNKELEKERKKKEKEEEVKVRDKLSHKTKLYEDMVDFGKQMAPENPEPAEETEEELEARRQPYANEKLLVESELVYFDVNQPEKNQFVHTKKFVAMGLNALDVTPVAGKWVHVVALNGNRLWVSTRSRRCTNLQLFYEEDQVVGALLKVTTPTRGQLKSGDDFDHLFVLEGELKKVSEADFVKLANRRFQRTALGNLSKLTFNED